MLKSAIKFPDPRTSNWFMVGSPFPVLGMLIFYNYFVQKLGVKLMKDRKPFNLDRIIQVYNVVQIYLCAWFSVQVRT